MIYNQKLLDKFATTLCSQCDKEALLRCDKTQLSFCSIACSDLLNKPHKIEAPLLKNEIRYDEEIKTGERVIITGIINEKCIYVRRTNVDFVLLLNQIHKNSERAEKLGGFVAVGDLCLARFEDEIYRSEVIDVSDNDIVTVRLIDYGNTARIHTHELMKMEQACQNLKCFTHKIYLKNVNVDAINDLIIEYLCNLLSSNAELLAKDVDDVEMELIVQSTNENVGCNLVRFSDVPSATYREPGVLHEELQLEHDLIPIGSNKNVFVVNVQPDLLKPELIAVVSEIDMKDLRELYRSINVYGKKHASGEFGIPCDGRVFLAFCNNQWHRAVVLQPTGDGFPLCQLIDLESMQKIRVKDMIPMPPLFADPPTRVTICRIEGFNRDSNAEVKTLVGDIVRENQVVTVDEIVEDDDDEAAIVLRFNSIIQSSASHHNETRSC